MKCPRCQGESPDGARFCEECGAQLETTCPTCGQLITPGKKFCRSCGASLPDDAARLVSPESYTPKHLAEKILTSRSALEGERKQVTVLFCDLVGSTALAERLGPEAMHALLSRFFELALAEVHQYEGTINQFLGDGFMALFGAPVAHEDHARRAALAAVGIQRALREQRGEFGLPDQAELSVRMGLNTGPVVVGKIGDNLRMDYTAVGDTTHLAARLQQLAEPGAIYMSEGTYRLVEPYADCEARGERSVKGRAERVGVYRLLAARARTARARIGARPIASPLVGRDKETAALTACLERLAGGQGGIVGILGEAGLGKSRLVTEVGREFGDRRVLWLEGRAVSFGQTLSYWPFLEILRRWAGITDEDGEAESQAKLARQVRGLFPDEVADVLPYLTTLLGLPVTGEFEHRVKYLDGQAMGRQVFRSTRRLFERLASKRPVVLVFEDLHWADASSAELIEHLFPLVQTIPLLVCGVSRPERASPAARLREVARAAHADRYTEIALAPLSPATSATLLDNLLVNPRVSVRLKDLILARTEGNPFFVEEVVRSLATAGTLLWDAGAGEWRMTGEVEQVTIPATLHGVIAARVDRLDEDVKQVLKVASVIGRSFLYRVLRAIAEASQQLDTRLDELQQLELIREKRRVPELEYFFKHALVQEATYESILLDRRRLLHRKVGESIERLFAERLDEFYGILAYHYARAEDWAKAQEYLFKAGDHAGRVAADPEALAHYRQAMEAYGRAFGDRQDSTQRASLDRKIGEALFRRGEHVRALEYLERALTHLGTPYPTARAGVRRAILKEVIRQAGHRLMPRLFLRVSAEVERGRLSERIRIYLMMEWIHYFTSLEHLTLDAMLHLNTAEASDSAPDIVVGSAGLGLILDIAGMFGVAAHYHKRADKLAERVQHPLAHGLTHFFRGWHEYYLGRWDAAVARFEASASACLAAGHLRYWGGARAMLLDVLASKGAIRDVLNIADELYRIGRDAADPEICAWACLGLGKGYRQTGAVSEAIPWLQRAVEFHEGIPDHLGSAQAGGELARCYLRQQNIREAMELLEKHTDHLQRLRARGHQITPVRIGAADAYLVVAERAEGPARARALKKAEAACKAALKQGRHVQDYGAPEALRLRGTYEWLNGNRRSAEECWDRSIAMAERLGARYVLAMSHLEIGRRLNRESHIERARAICREIGAESAF